jgi:hydroxylamine reductase
MNMYCYQCEQTSQGKGCTVTGVCGKDSTVATLQDAIVYGLKGIAMYAHRARNLGAIDKEIDIFVVKALFTTITNVNFDPARLMEMIKQVKQIEEKAKQLYFNTCTNKNITAENMDNTPSLSYFNTKEEIINHADVFSIAKRKDKFGEDITSLQELLTYGLKGTAAYADHAYILGQESDDVYAFFEEALDFLTDNTKSVAELVEMNMKCGKVNFQVMELLDKANTNTYGNPVPTQVRIEPIKGKAILVSGHDLKDLEELLKQTEGKGINIYTHGEMLPAHGYPELKKYCHLAGNYGGAWQDQQKEFDQFPGAILMTTNCIQKPKETYKGRIFTTGLVAWPDVVHISDGNFSPVIQAALNAEGFTQDGSDKTILVGFGHNAVLGVADKVIDAVKQGKIKHFYLIGGCDGAKSGRNYYTDLAALIPKDSIILTLACGKYRFNKLEFGDIDGIPRLLDIGQCNDAYSAIKIALALAEAFKTDVNSLPLSMILSWYEQKAVCILLTLLSLGVKNIRLGPTLPAFVSPNVLNVLVENFNIMPITTPAEDLQAIAG